MLPGMPALLIAGTGLDLSGSWEADAEGWDLAGMPRTTANPRTGSYAITGVFNGTGYNGVARRTVTAAEHGGRALEVSVWHKTSATSGEVRIQELATAVSTGFVASTGTYQQLTLTLPVIAGNVTIELRTVGDDEYTFMDDWRIRAL